MGYTFSQDEINGFVILLFSCFISACGGIGGGGINLPVILTVMKVPYSEAVSLSLCAVLGNTGAQILVNFRNSHPQCKDRSIIYWEIVAFLLPLQLGGSNIASLFTKSLPEFALLICAVATLLFSILKTLIKARLMYRNEQLLLLDQNSSIFAFEKVEDQGQNERLIAHVGVSYENVALGSDGRDKNAHPLTKPLLFALLILWIICALLSFFMLNDSEKCSPLFYVLLFLRYPFIFGVVYYAYQANSKRQRNFPATVLKGDYKFVDANIFVPILAFLIGCLCALLGIGGGELMGPLLLQLGLLSDVSSATTAVMSFYTTSSNILTYGISGSIPKINGIFTPFLRISVQ